MSAEIAKARLHYICALDRAKFDGRQRIANLYSSGTRVVFDKPLSILPDEELLLDYVQTENGLEGHAIITGRAST